MLDTVTLAEVERAILYQKYNRIQTFFPDSGAYRRELYPKHLAFLEAGAQYSERLIIAANRVGKSELGAYETTLHATGLYPTWWKGKRFSHPISGWAAGDTSKTVREIVQEKLLGPAGAHGTGMIPGELLARITTKQGISDAIDTIYVRHVSGGLSTIALKSYDQRREAFQGTARHWIWCDEEPPQDIWTECCLRLMTVQGCAILTFTPLMGWTDVVDDFLNEEKRVPAGRWYITATWNDVPHLSEEDKRKYESKIPGYQREARMKGIPALGSGAIYKIADSDIEVKPFAIPKHWPRFWAMDVGWNRTAIGWFAWDRDADTVYLYSLHYQAEEKPVTHAGVIEAHGKWIPGVVDPAARGRSQVDGEQLLEIYRRKYGLDITPAINTVEAGIYEVEQRLISGRLKVLSTCTPWFEEKRKYRRDEKGKVVKQDDHAMDMTRYGIMSGLKRAITEPEPKARRQPQRVSAWS